MCGAELPRGWVQFLPTQRRSVNNNQPPRNQDRFKKGLGTPPWGRVPSFSLSVLTAGRGWAQATEGFGINQCLKPPLPRVIVPRT